MRSRRRHLRLVIFLAISTCIILLGGGVTLLWQVQHRQVTRADDGDIIGSPTLPARTVDHILARVGSPMVGTGAVIERASRQANIDDAFALAVWWTETNDGAAGVGLADRNPGSVRGGTGYPVAYDGYTIYPSYSAGITDWFSLLKKRYVSRGLISAYTICYPYVGTANSYRWAGKVVNLMLHYRGQAPSPTPKPSPTVAKPTPDPVQAEPPKAHVVAGVFATQGRAREGQHIARDVQAPVITSHVPAASPQTPPAVQSSGLSTMLSVSLLIIVLGLLAALAIALWRLKIGRGRIAVSTVLEPISDVSTQSFPVFALANEVALPPLYANEFSPVLAPQFSPRTEQLLWMQDEQALQPVLSLAGRSVSGGGLLKRYASTNVAALADDKTTDGAYLEDYQQVEVAKNSYRPITESLSDPYISAAYVPEPAKIGMRRGGGFRRYVLEKTEPQ